MESFKYFEIKNSLLYTIAINFIMIHQYVDMIKISVSMIYQYIQINVGCQ